jgi:hypothetical protein
MIAFAYKKISNTKKKKTQIDKKQKKKQPEEQNKNKQKITEETYLLKFILIKLIYVLCKTNILFS